MESSAAVNDGVRMARSDGDSLHPPTQQPQQLGAAPVGSLVTGSSSTAPPPKASQAAATPHGARQASAGAGGGVMRLRVSVAKKGNKLGFGVRHDRAKRLAVSTVVGQSALCEGDTLVSVNGLRLDGLEFLAIVEHLKALPPGNLVFDIERPVVATSRSATKAPGRSGVFSSLPEPSSTSAANASAAPCSMPEPTANAFAANGAHVAVTSAVMPVERVAGSVFGPVRGLVSSATPAMTSASGNAAPIPLGGNTSISIQPSAASRTPLITEQPPLKKPRLSSSFNEPTGTNPLSATAINSRLLHAAPLGANAAAIPPEKKPPTVNALMKELEKQRAEKASLENKSAGLRKRLQQMLIDCDEVRVRASAEVQVVKDKAQREVEAAQRALVEARAQLRLADRAPDFGRIDSAVDDLEAARIQIEKLKQADSERTALFNARCSMENRLAEREARRLLDVLTADGCAQLRIIARRQASSSGVANGTTAAGGATDVVTITREGVRRLAFLKFFGLPHDFLHYMSPSFQSLDVLRHEVDRDQLVDLFGSAMRHEERAGLFYVAAAPMSVTFDPRTETLTLKCGWTEQNAIRELARNFRF